MPRHRRGRGFSYIKRGRSKTETGGSGRGVRGRPQSRQSTVGDLSLELSEGYESSDCSNVSESFRNALMSPNPSDSEESRGCNTPEMPPPASPLVPPSSPPLFFPSAPSLSSTPRKEPSDVEQQTPEESPLADIAELKSEVLQLLKGFLPNGWMSLEDENGFQLIMLSRGEIKTIQRNIRVSVDGMVEVSVHRRQLQTDFMDAIIKSVGGRVPLSQVTLKKFVDRLVAIVKLVRSFEICTGAQYSDFERFWHSDPHGFIDNNPYDESRYEVTFRANDCLMLLPINVWKCAKCAKCYDRFRKRRAEDVPPNINTPNIYLTEEEKLEKLASQHRSIRAAQVNIERLKKKFAESLEKTGVVLHQSLEERLSEILKESKLTPLQELFIQQQFKACSVNDRRQMRWHPTIIRFALYVKSKSTSAYVAMRDSGFLELPSERTLYDYSTLLPRKEGCHAEKMDKLYNKVKDFPHEFQKYHTLIMDEIHISQKLVYLRSTGELVGYVNLDEAEEEMKYLSDVMSSGEKNADPPVAKKILAYMVKGVCSKTKEVVASFTTAKLTMEDLYSRTWDVIKKCEVGGIKITAIVCDGSEVNRAFIRMHPLKTVLPSGLVHDTVHLCDPSRTLFFVSDVPHLLKTIRNCFSKSGTHPKCKRKLTKKGEVIAWKTIQRLYLEDHENTWRQSFKLTSQNVYLNSYSCMKVAYAAQVLSKTVALDLHSRNWRGTSQTVEFIHKVNDFFDCLNGAHRDEGKFKCNPLLNPYTSHNDERFQMLYDFLEYLKEWEKEVESVKNVSKEAKAKMLLSRQTLEGIEITIHSFIGVVQFMLDKGANFVIGRNLNQDPLEQTFGKHREAHGGSNNPTVIQYLETDNKLSVVGDINVSRKRGSNVQGEKKLFEISEEPLPKRQRQDRVKKTL